MAVPLQAGQILFVNLLDARPARGGHRQRAGQRRCRASAAPRPPDQRLLDRAQLWRIGLLGSTVAVIVSMLAAGWAGWQHRPAQSTLFLALTFGQLAIALAGRPAGHRLRDNRMLLWSVLINVLLVLAAVFAAPLRELLPDPAGDRRTDLIAAGLAAAGVAALARSLALRTARAGRPVSRPAGCVQPGPKALSAGGLAGNVTSACSPPSEGSGDAPHRSVGHSRLVGSGHSHVEALRRAAVRATWAPSVHNTQPWRFVIGHGALEVHADFSRQLRFWTRPAGS